MGTSRGVSRINGALLAVAALLALSVPTNMAMAAPGEVSEFSVPTEGSRPTGIAPGSDGNLWFTEEAANQIGRITPGGEITEFPVPTANSQPVGITAGPDGNLWFTEQAANQIGRITTAGEITEFPLGLNGSQPTAIAVGPDGKVLFTELGAGRVGLMAPNGDYTWYSFQSEYNWSSRATGITAGPDGELWVSARASGYLGWLWVGPQNEATLGPFAIPTPHSEPGDLAAGPDGNLWFTEMAANQIGRRSLLSSPSPDAPAEFPLPTPAARPTGIAAGPDGNMWFTEPSANRIGGITPKGRITEFALPAGGDPIEITAGPDGNMWFTEPSANRIGRITPGLLEVEIEDETLPADQPNVSLRMSCSGGAGMVCRGAVRLSTRSKRGKKGRRRAMTIVLAHGTFTIPSGVGKRIALHLSRRARGLLTQRHRLRATAAATVVGGQESSGAITFRQRGPRSR